MPSLSGLVESATNICRRWYGTTLLRAMFRRFAPGSPSAQARMGQPSVCLLEGWLGPGGAERQLVNLAATLHRMGHRVRVRVLSLEGRAGHYAPYLRRLGIDAATLSSDLRLEELPGGNLLRPAIPRSQRAAVAALAEDLLRDPVDIVHAYYDHPNIFGAWAAILARTPAIRCSWRDRNPEGLFYFAPWMRDQYRILARLPNLRFEANSRFAALSYADWIGLDAKNVDIIPNALAVDFADDVNADTRKSVRAAMGIPPDVPVLLFSGRLSPKKRPFDMLDAFMRVQAARSAVHCLVAGSDFLDEEFIEAASAFPSELRSRLHILGLRSDIAALLSASDILLQTSSVESCSNALLEAMRMGLPVVATDTGGTPELVRDGENGFLVPVGATAVMVERLIKLIDDAPLRTRMGAAGREDSLRFTPESTYSSLNAAYLRGLGVA